MLLKVTAIKYIHLQSFFKPENRCFKISKKRIRSFWTWTIRPKAASVSWKKSLSFVKYIKIMDSIIAWMSAPLSIWISALRYNYTGLPIIAKICYRSLCHVTTVIAMETCTIMIHPTIHIVKICRNIFTRVRNIKASNTWYSSIRIWTVNSPSDSLMIPRICTIITGDQFLNNKF